jgi:type IV pilus assembly protein PilE
LNERQATTMQTNDTRTAGGFTLIEAMIVLAILAILAALAWPTYTGSLVRIRRVEGQVALIEAMQKQELYRARRNTYLAYSAEEAAPPDAELRWWSGRDPAASAYEIDARACEGEDIADCVELRAQPGTARVDRRFRDPGCGVLTLDSRGRQGASGAAPRCWP